MDAVNKRQKMIEEFYHIFDQWLTLYEEGVGVDSILIGYKYYNVAIYGMGTMAMHLIAALKESQVSIKYIIDKNSADFYTDVKVVSLEEVKEPVDVIICTCIDENYETIKQLSERLNCSVVSLADIVFENL